MTDRRRDRIRRIEAKRPAPVVVEVERVEREGARDRLVDALMAVLQEQRTNEGNRR